jgi:protein-S-isoprenylcysteine O-methyltransferase Ste14
LYDPQPPPLRLREGTEAIPDDRRGTRQRPPGRPPRGPAIVLSVLAVALFNVGLALLIVTLLGRPSPLPAWASAALLFLGLVAAAIAIHQWRTYLRVLHA